MKINDIAIFWLPALNKSIAIKQKYCYNMNRQLTQRKRQKEK